jgi:ABC-type antimicrobial peptide transport system permease subunit
MVGIMKNKVGFVSGIALTIFGIWILSLTFTDLQDKGLLIFTLIFGGLSVILGIYILFNFAKEDTIEQIKSKAGKNE